MQQCCIKTFAPVPEPAPKLPADAAAELERRVLALEGKGDAAPGKWTHGKIATVAAVAVAALLGLLLGIRAAWRAWKERQS